MTHAMLMPAALAQLTLGLVVGAVAGFLATSLVLLWCALRVQRQGERERALALTRAERELEQVNIMIPGEQVPAIRSACYSNLGIAADAAGALTCLPQRVTDPQAYEPVLDRLDGARALLDALGWEASTPELTIELSAPPRGALTAALDRALILARARADSNGEGAEQAVLARLADDVLARRASNSQEREQALRRGLAQIVLGVAELGLIVESDLSGTSMLAALRCRVRKLAGLIEEGLALVPPRSADARRDGTRRDLCAREVAAAKRPQRHERRQHG